MMVVLSRLYNVQPVYFYFELWGPGDASKRDGSFQTGFGISRNRSRVKTLQSMVPLWELPYTVLSAHTAARQTIGPRLGWQNKKLLARALDWCRLARSLCTSEQVFWSIWPLWRTTGGIAHQDTRVFTDHDDYDDYCYTIGGLPTLVDNNYR